MHTLYYKLLYNALFEFRGAKLSAPKNKLEFGKGLWANITIKDEQELIKQTYNRDISIIDEIDILDLLIDVCEENFRDLTTETGAWRKNKPFHLFDMTLCGEILRFLQDKGVKAIADLGCGDCSYSKVFIDNGFDVFACDGNPYTEELTDGIGKCRDLAKPVDIGQYDWVLSLEVGEHIPAIYFSNFIDNLCNAAKEGIILSWAIPGQGGFGHYNEQPNSVIKREFEKRGFSFDKEQTDYFRGNCHYFWFTGSLMVFARNSI